MNKTPFHTIVTQLTDGHTPRVWSLLVTVFGELAQDQGAQISALMLRRICALIGIKPEAMRVALHRLRKDGWIGNQRNGRSSAYFLTDWGRAQSAAATPRIYSAQATVERAWLVVSDPAQAQDHAGDTGIWLSSNLLLTANAVPCDDRFYTQLDDASALPNWMKAKVCDPAMRATADAFLDTLQQVQSDLGAAPALTTLEQATLRILLVHSWRRIILKTPELPDFVYPTDWAGPSCRSQITRLLKVYPALDLAALSYEMNKHAD